MLDTLHYALDQFSQPLSFSAQWIVIAIFAILFICLAIFAWLVWRAPIGEEIENVGWVGEEDFAALNAEWNRFTSQADRLHAGGQEAIGGKDRKALNTLCSHEDVQ